MKVGQFEVECHVGDTNEDNRLDKDGPEVIVPLPLEHSEHPHDVGLLRVVCHGVHGVVPNNVLHQLSVAEVCGPITGGTVLGDLNQHRDVLLWDSIDLKVEFLKMRMVTLTIPVAACCTLACQMDTSGGRSRS